MSDTEPQLFGDTLYFRKKEGPLAGPSDRKTGDVNTFYLNL